ncbi:MAG: SURF1 family protein [Hyphomicrobiaceae bacterium]|nr:SURF1 family protein [Hyphomicrobiaceae bacterium]
MLLFGLLIVTVTFLALGIWQVQRMVWKHELMARIETRVAAVPVTAPGPARWPQITAADDEYTRVVLNGTYLHDREALVAASTERGPGYWVMTPLAQPDGTVVIVNRGFVTAERRSPVSRMGGQTPGPVAVLGLLRLSEAGAWILRQNDPQADRWYRRDPLQLGQARGLTRVAPYFVDAEASPPGSEWPMGGMTRIRFSDNHFVYALTWFVLAALAAFAAAFVLRSEFRRAG